MVAHGVDGGSHGRLDGRTSRTPTGIATGCRPLVTGRRLGAELLDIGLALVLFGIGWVIWLIFTSKQGQSPGKKLLGMRSVSVSTGRSLDFGMTFLRDFFLKGFIGGATFGIAYLWILWDPRRQALYDKLITATVVNDPTGATLGPATAQPTATSF